MAKEGATYVCDICQQIIVVQKSGAGTLVCCNQPMREYTDDQSMHMSKHYTLDKPYMPTLEEPNSAYLGEYPWLNFQTL